MKHASKHPFKFIGLMLVLTACPVLTAHALEDAIIAVVNDDIITLKELQTFLAASYKQFEAGARSEAELKAIAEDLEKNSIDRLVDDRLILSAAKAKGYSPKPDAVSERVTELQAKYPSKEAFLTALTQDGLSITDLRQQISSQLIGKYFIEQEIKAKIFVAPQEVTEYYNTHLSDFTKPERINLDSIFIPYENEDRSSAQLKAQEAHARVKNDENFRAVAKECSTLPPLGVISKGQLRPELEKALFKLEINQISEPIESDGGIFIVKILGKITPETSSLEDVRANISAFLQNKKFKEELQTWISTEREKAYIEIKKP